MVRTRETHGKTTTETSYYLLSTPLSALRFTEVARAQWGIENGLHWVLDVTMNEDRKRNWKDHGPENIGLLRRLALNLARLEGSNGSIKRKLKRAGWNDAFLARLLGQFAKAHMRKPWGFAPRPHQVRSAPSRDGRRPWNPLLECCLGKGAIGTFQPPRWPPSPNNT